MTTGEQSAVEKLDLDTPNGIASEVLLMKSDVSAMSKDVDEIKKDVKQILLWQAETRGKCDIHTEDIVNLQRDVRDARDQRNTWVGGWKGIVLIIGVVAFLLTQVWSVIAPDIKKTSDQTITVKIEPGPGFVATTKGD